MIKIEEMPEVDEPLPEFIVKLCDILKVNLL